MKIKLNRLTLLNFKGIRTLDVEFSQLTNISGENATGKSTIFDAFLWLLFGKDSSDRKDFQIKTLDAENKPFQRMDHEVTAFMTVDGEELVLKRVFKEKWEKKKGNSTQDFTGHSTSYYWNDVPLKLEEYQAKINEILNENVFKLITNTGYFNTLKWPERRGVLMQIGGKIDYITILDKIATVENKDAIAVLTTALNAKKTVKDYRLQLAAQKKKIKDDLDLIPSRIDEATRSLPDEKNFADVEATLNETLTDLEATESLLMNKTKAQKDHQSIVTAKLTEVQVFRTRRQDIEFEIKNSTRDSRVAREQEILDIKRESRTADDDVLRISNDYARNNGKKKQAIASKDALTAEWYEVDGKQLTFNEGEFCCPTCKRAYEDLDVDAKKAELTKNFNTNKSTRLAEITASGQELKTEIERYGVVLADLDTQGKAARAKSEELKQRIATLEQAHQELSMNETLEVQRAIATNAEYVSLGKKMASLQEEIDAPDASQDNTDLIQHKRALNEKITALRKELSTKDYREKGLLRIKELEAQEKEMGAELAKLEGIEFCIDQYVKAEMDELDSRINGRFKLVRFKLFEEQINGGQSECCEALINGVPYSDANTASRINAGLDIINTLCKHYDAYAPVFVDNAESINTLLPVNSQLIRLVVSKDKKLKIETQKDLFSAAVA